MHTSMMIEDCECDECGLRRAEMPRYWVCTQASDLPMGTRTRERMVHVVRDREQGNDWIDAFYNKRDAARRARELNTGSKRS